MKKKNDIFRIVVLWLASVIIGILIAITPFLGGLESVEFIYTIENVLYAAVALSFLVMIASFACLRAMAYRKCWKSFSSVSKLRFQNAWSSLDLIFKYFSMAYPDKAYGIGMYCAGVGPLLDEKKQKKLLIKLDYFHNYMVRLRPDDLELYQRMLDIFLNKPDFSTPLFPNKEWIRDALNYHIEILKKINSLNEDISKLRSEKEAELKKTAQSDSSATALIASD